MLKGPSKQKRFNQTKTKCCCDKDARWRDSSHRVLTSTIIYFHFVYLTAHSWTTMVRKYVTKLQLWPLFTAICHFIDWLYGRLSANHVGNRFIHADYRVAYTRFRGQNHKNIIFHLACDSFLSGSCGVFGTKRRFVWIWPNRRCDENLLKKYY